ncbi:MAG: translation initiation factor IF-3 [Clostridiales bacterium]|jgi:translation initiation factor IF-3|nr:translation initiation factor IF-3 [Clostridiales bacterium]
MRWIVYTIHFFIVNLFIRFNLWRCTIISDIIINEKIRDKEVRVIGQDGEQMGIMSSRDALNLAREQNLDLIKIAPKAKPPVCKIMDFGKYKYEQTKREKEAKKKQKTIDVKEVRLSPNIDEHDLSTKANHARKFLANGDRVKVTLRFRGREMAHKATGKEIMDTFFKRVEDIAAVDKPAKMEGRNMVMFLSQKRQ